MMLAFAVSTSLQSCSNEDNALSHKEVLELQQQRLDQQAEEREKAAYPGTLIIKEVNVGGITGYNWCKGIVLYNNGATAITLSNLGIASPAPATATVASNIVNGKLSYEDEGFVPALYAVWYFKEAVTIEPYSDVVVAVNGAIDHTDKGGFDLSGADYAMFDKSGSYINASAYPDPDASIPESNWLNVIVIGQGNSWPIAMMCPGLFVFQAPAAIDIPQYFNNQDNVWYNGGSTTQANRCIKVPNEWIVDGAEFFQVGKEGSSYKRLPAAIDAGYGLYNNLKGYSAYRNVDKKATESLHNNADKLVYGYDQAVEGTCDASNIDAAASIRNGAKIIYKDTNNSTADFHLRAGWSLQ